MSDIRKGKLLKLNKEQIVDALLKLAEIDDRAENLVKKLARDPKEHLKYYRQKISGLKRRKKFVFRRESAALAKSLIDLLGDIRSSNLDPLDGMKLTASFFETDEAVFESSDDSNGYIGESYRYWATEVLHHFAAKCENKKKALEIIIKIYSNNMYGTRDFVLDEMPESLGEAESRNAIEIFRILADEENDRNKKWKNLWAIETLAEKLGDAKLYEKTKLEIHEKPSVSDFINISRVYLECKDAESALYWIKRIPENQTYMQHDRQELLQRIYNKLGDSDKEAEMAWLKFRGSRSLSTLENLLGIVGNDKRKGIIDDEAANIIDGGMVDYGDIQFLLDVKKFEEAEICVLSKAAANMLNGDYYSAVLPLAQGFEAEGRMLAASVIYRALLNSILERKFYKGYPIAARYLQKLDMLAFRITDWKDFGENGMYHVWLNQVHGKKSSFWNHYRSK